MIVATAGHVDHGKTRLVQALTGIDTDSLAEERRRGMTIEPGYAHADLGLGEPIGFVDVPGHERFIRNMLAGIAAVDFALLVIAADDGPMPQTKEHLTIIDLLQIPRGAVALTKTDRVPATRLRDVATEVTALLAQTSLRGSPLFPVSTVSGEGLARLRAHLVEAQRSMPVRMPEGHFRLAVDRCFTRPGAGLVVTGAVLSGQACPGDELVVSPSGEPLRLRGIQIHGHAASLARAGQRCALNLAGVGTDRAEVGRGDWIVARAAHAPTSRLDVQLHLLPSVKMPPSGHATWQLHLGAATHPVRVVALDAGALAAGTAGPAQLVLRSAVSALRGDRFVLRDPSAQLIVGGGRVLDAFATARGRARPQRLADLEALMEEQPGNALARLVKAHPEGIEWPRFALTWNLDDSAWSALCREAPIHAAEHRAGLRLIERGHWQALQARVELALARVHEERPEQLGLDDASLAMALGPGVDAVLRHAALRARMAAGAIVRDGFVLRLASHRARLDAEDRARLQQLSTVLRSFGLRPPPLGELAPLLGLDADASAAFLQRAAVLGHLVRVARNRYFLPATIETLVRLARECAEAAPEGRFDAAAFRDRSGIGRNLSIQVLEFFDRSGITRFAGERRWMTAGAETFLVPRD